jgi:hypothetical protein
LREDNLSPFLPRQLDLSNRNGIAAAQRVEIGSRGVFKAIVAAAWQMRRSAA